MIPKKYIPKLPSCKIKWIERILRNIHLFLFKKYYGACIPNMGQGAIYIWNALSGPSADEIVSSDSYTWASYNSTTWEIERKINKMIDDIPYDDEGKYYDGVFLHVKGSFCPECNRYLGETLESWSQSRHHEWEYYRCTHCNHEWDVYLLSPTGGSGPCDRDDLVLEEEKEHHYIKAGEPKRFTHKRFIELQKERYSK
jgi:hypothetical protein